MGLVQHTSLLPVEAGQEGALRRRLDTLGDGGDSPFATVPGTHMARLFVLDHYGGPPGGNHHRRIDPALLAFSAVLDGPLGPWLDGLRAALGSTGEEIWCHCPGFPGMRDGAAFSAWLLRHEIAPSMPIIAYPDATVGQVRRGLELRARLADLAERAQGAKPSELRAAYREVFDR